ncbi:MAG: FIST C-terminal domain-containing protein [Bacteroidia bacterium]|nr:FIST C-terminal domain-containing protein [Bacteroidia bacterium]
MLVEQRTFKGDKWKIMGRCATVKTNANLVFAFGGRDLLEDPKRVAEIKKFYPKAQVILGSTSGEILNTSVLDDTIIATAIQFEKTPISVASVQILDLNKDSRKAGEELAKQLSHNDLRHVFVVSDGLMVNGTDLIAGLNAVLPKGISVTGGLAGDGARFQKTLVGLNNSPKDGLIVAVGFYGQDIKIGYGTMGGWETFGPERVVTKSEANVLYELDGKPALALYKEYLGEKASELPASALLFPLSLRAGQNNEERITRTVLSVDEATQSMTFAGDIPQGSHAQLMKANFDRLIQGANHAAQQSMSLESEPQLALLVSCVGRKLVLGQKIEDEVEAVRETIGGKAAITGFYSYGELAPGVQSVETGKKSAAQKGEACYLHNQTMTISLFSE